MTDQKSGTRSSIGLLDIITHVPGVLADTPSIVRGAITGFLARPSAKTSIALHASPQPATADRC